MAALITSDWHLSAEPRDAYRLRTLRKLLPEFIQQHKVERLLFLGDICEAKDNHSATLVNQIADLFHELSQSCQITINQGNHDWQSSPSEAFFRFLHHIPNILWVAKPSIVGSFGAVFLPHTPNPERDWKPLDFHNINYIFAHQTFTGALSDNGALRLNGASLSLLPPNIPIISGDIHRPQELGRLTYVGSPYSTDFGDNWSPRMLLLKAGRLTSLPCPGPQKRLLELNSMQELTKAKINAGDLLKIRLRIEPNETQNWPMFVQKLREWCATKDVTLCIAQPIVTEVTPNAALRSSTPRKADDQLLVDYAAERGVDKDTTRAGLKLL